VNLNKFFSVNIFFEEVDMFDIRIQNGKEVFLNGRFDASQKDKADNVLGSINENCIINFKDLEYISSAGLGELIKTYTRLKALGKSIELTNMNKHISEVFRYAGLDKVFTLE
jgi:anti-anti-sigma factor